MIRGLKNGAKEVIWQVKKW